jgi:hypothetical protein
LVIQQVLEPSNVKAAQPFVVPHSAQHAAGEFAGVFCMVFLGSPFMSKCDWQVGVGGDGGAGGALHGTQHCPELPVSHGYLHPPAGSWPLLQWLRQCPHFGPLEPLDSVAMAETMSGL